MSEETINALIKNDNYTDILVELTKIYPNGFDINELDKRIQERLNELQNKYYNIQQPI